MDNIDRQKEIGLFKIANRIYIISMAYIALLVFLFIAYINFGLFGFAYNVAVEYLPIIIFVAGLYYSHYSVGKSDLCWINDHFIWQKNTLMVVLTYIIVVLVYYFVLVVVPFMKISLGTLIVIIFIGLGLMIWFLYRVIRGYIRLNRFLSPYKKRG